MHFSEDGSLHFSLTKGLDEDNFNIPSPGLVSFNGSESMFEIMNEAIVHMIYQGIHSNYFGVSADFRKVSLLDCSPMDPHTAMLYAGGGRIDPCRKFVARPQCVIVGDRYVRSVHENISSIYFKFDGIDDFFGQYIFGLHIEDQIRSANISIETRDGEAANFSSNASHDSLLTFRARPAQIFSVTTDIGEVMLLNFPNIINRIPGSINISGNFFVRIEPKLDIPVSEVTNYIIDVKTLFDVITGSTGRARNVMIGISDEEGEEQLVDAFFTGVRERHEWGVVSSKISAGSLLNYFGNEEKFKEILIKWLENSNDMRPSRRRFSDAFRYHRLISIDRIIAAANLFDLLPEARKPAVSEIVSQELRDLVKNTVRSFKNLPSSPERDSFIGSASRAGKPVLKSIIRYRAKEILKYTDSFNRLDFVINEAIDCRNYFVHGGSSPKIDYQSETSIMYFFATTLEFVYGVSELINAGWDLNSWLNGWREGNHPWYIYISTYPQNLELLDRTLEKTRSRRKHSGSSGGADRD